MANSGSFDIDRIRKGLEEAGLRFVDEVVILPSKEGGFAVLVPEERVQGRASKAATSVRQLELLTKRLSLSLGIAVSWMRMRAEGWEAIERSLRRLLELKFAGKFQSVLLSSLSLSPAIVWVAAAPNEVPPCQEDVEREILAFLRPFGVELVEVVLLARRNLITSPLLLRQIKVRAPISLEDLRRALAEQDFDVTRDRTLENSLDTLRRRGLVSRSADGVYSLTEEGLRFVPHAAGRSSSDVERVLALGRRKW